jgi:endopeptidase La
MLKHIKNIKDKMLEINGSDLIKTVKKQFADYDKPNLILNIKKINDLIECKSLSFQKIEFSGVLKKDLLTKVSEFIEYCKISQKDILLELNSKIKPLSGVSYQIKSVESNFGKITDYMKSVKKTLDASVHGHDKAKKQIERIIGQWINGEQDGYCFGFEGPPGVGKTSMAKTGLANCLLDENGNSRPFAMIQMGGDSNGSSLHGHNYTYVGSTWGGIVQILIDKKCMNPIILIDELDKISKTEHGREIVGILTHLLDPTQNDCFQDKYFSGIDLDLSKALFILSYNDVDSIDKILLDRIHRVKFSSLSLEDKLVIAETHLLPEVYKKMGLKGIIHISEDVIKFIIDEYTSEPGVRKFKEILFEIVGEINLDILKNQQTMLDYPITITTEDIKTKYFKDKQEIKITKIPEARSVGIINGLWANAMGRGGIIPIQARYYPCDKFLNLKLTGMQGDVMKESMNVALTLAWSLTSFENREKVRELYEEKRHGIHIHCPEGSVPKDGPSAGTAITTVIYSLFNNQKIKHNVAITGEISLDGRCTEIGGLDLKFLGGIKAGVKEFIYPTENEKDYKSFMEKYENKDIVKDIIFHPVSNINEVFELVFEK